jgi:outer membrane protein TolC
LNSSRRPDLLSVFVTMDLPLFADKKQDQQYKSKIHSISAAEAQRDDRLQQYHAKFSNALSQLQFIQQRLSLYQEKLLPQAKAHIHSTEQAYQSNTASFDRLTQSYIGELTLALEYQKLLTDQALIQSQVRFFQAL